MSRPRLLLSAIVALLLGVALAACSNAAAPAPTPSASRPIALPSDATAYFFGDSWTTGYSADEGRSFPYVVGEAMGWKVALGPDNSGAGYVHTFNPYHPVFPKAAAAADAITADVIVLQGSVNDVPGPLTDLRGAVRQTVGTLREKSGDTPIVMVGPAPYQATPPAELAEIDRTEAAVARQLRIPYVSPLREGWFDAPIVEAMIDPKSLHPTTAGHAYFGGRVASALARVTTTAGRSAATAATAATSAP